VSTLNTPVEVRISFPTSNQTGLGVEISLTDRMSGTRFATVDLTPAQFTELLASRNVITMGDLAGADTYANQVGKDYETRVVHIPEEFQKYHPGWDEKRENMKGPTPQMESYGEACAADGWDGYRWTRHNYGWSLRVFRYRETTEEERRAELDSWR
jgi:hypothetical protein